MSAERDVFFNRPTSDETRRDRRQIIGGVNVTADRLAKLIAENSQSGIPATRKTFATFSMTDLSR